MAKETKDKWQDAAEEGMGGGKEKTPKKEIKEVRVRKGTSGGHVIEHHHTRPDHHPMEEHVTSNDDQMASHMLQNMGNENPDQQAAPDPNAGAAPAPQGSGAPMPMAGGQ